MTIAATVERALAFWRLDGSDHVLIAQRENIVFRVTDRAGARFALRLHRPGYQTVQMIQSELVWVRHLGARGLNVPAPLPARPDTFLIEVDGYHADLLSWLDGVPMGATGQPLALDDRAGTFRNIGALMAWLHLISDDWHPPEGFVRHHWDADGLFGKAPIWDRFWDNPGLSVHQRNRILTARDRLRADLDSSASDFGLIHADMLRENVMIDGNRLGLIDFDDSGFGYRLFDVATALFKNRSEPDYASLQTAFLEGYRRVRPLDTELLGQFMLIRALSYLGWIITRMDEPGASVRQARFLDTSLPMVDAYLGNG